MFFSFIYPESVSNVIFLQIRWNVSLIVIQAIEMCYSFLMRNTEKYIISGKLVKLGRFKMNKVGTKTPQRQILNLI